MRRSTRRWAGCTAGLILELKLTEAWKKALFNDFHDVAAGSSLGIIYKDAQRDYDQVYAGQQRRHPRRRSRPSMRASIRGEPVCRFWSGIRWLEPQRSGQRRGADASGF